MATSKSYLIKIGADANAVTKAIQGINGQTSSLKRLAGTLDSAFKINGDTSVLKAKLTALNGAVKSSEQSANSLRAQFAKMSSGANFNPASASAQKLQMRIAQADAETLKLKAQADQTSTALDKMANADIGKLGNEAKSAGGGFTVLKGAMAGIVANTVTSALSAIGSGITELAGTMNANSKAWQTFTGNMQMMGQSTSSINATKKALQDFATQTIFSASDMASTYSQLNAVGTKNTLSLVKGFGGLASAAEDPQQAMKTLSQQATQMAAKPTVTWEDFKLMLEQTPAGVSAIAKTMGMSTAELVKNVQDGTVNTQKFFDAISKTGTNKAFTKMATQFKTVDQAVDGLKENLANKLQPAFDAVSQVGIQAISALTDGLNGFKMPSFDLSGLSTIGNQIKAMFAGLDFSGLTNLGNAILPALQSAFTVFLSYVTPALQPLLNAFKNLWDAIQPIISVVASSLMPIFQVLGAYIGGFVSGAMTGITTAFNILTGVIKFLTPVFQFIGKVIQAVGPILSVVAGFVGKLMGSFTAFNGVMGIVGKVAGSIFKGVSSAGRGLWSSLSGIFKSVSGAFKSVGNSFKAVGGWIKSVFSSVGGSAGNAVSRILGAFRGIGGKIGGFFKGVYGKISSSIGKVGDIGKNIVTGIANGISGAWGAVTDAISRLTDMIPKKIRKWLGIHSPSRVMRDQVGQYIPQGIAVGMTGQSDFINRKASVLKNQLTNSLTNFQSPAVTVGTTGQSDVINQLKTSLTDLQLSTVTVDTTGISDVINQLNNSITNFKIPAVTLDMTGLSDVINQLINQLNNLQIPDITLDTTGISDVINQLKNSITSFKIPSVALGSGSLNSSAGLVGSSSNSTSVVINVSGGDPNAVVPLIRRELRRNGIS